jgi:enamine deaminase RidA (YjgF/YER057c/UK114 family)
MSIKDRLLAKGMVLPPPVQVPPGVRVSFAWARRHGDRIYVAGHGPQRPDGSLAHPLGPVGNQVSAEQAQEAARLSMLSALASVQREIGDLDLIEAWLRVEGYVLASPKFSGTTNVVNGASDLILELFGDQVGRHARTAMGVAATPLNCPVVIAAEIALRSKG